MGFRYLRVPAVRYAALKASTYFVHCLSDCLRGLLRAAMHVFVSRERVLELCQEPFSLRLGAMREIMMLRQPTCMWIFIAGIQSSVGGYMVVGISTISLRLSFHI